MAETPFLNTVLVFLIAAVFVVALFRQFRLSPILGYLVAGILIGPAGLGIINDITATRGLAQLGLVFLLFTIGLELSFERLNVMRLHVFGLGSAQVAACSLVLGGLAWLAGLSLPSAILVGGALALSSTAIVLQSLVERRESASHSGRVALSILLLQDLAVVPFLVLVPLLAESSGSVPFVLGIAVAKAVIVLVVIVLVGRLLLRPLFRIIAAHRTPELFVALTLLVVLATSWVTELAGLTLALGAFLAGLLMAETEFRHQVEADIQPFRGILLGLFFMTVGMTMDLGLALEQPVTLAVIVVVLIAVKAVIIAALCRAFGHSNGSSLRLGLLLSQGGEFAFVLFGLALAHGVLPPPQVHLLILAVAVTMLLTPLLNLAGKRLSERMERRRLGGVERIAEEVEDLRNHVLIAGFGRVGQTVAKLLTSQQIPFIALDLETGRVAEGQARDLPVFYGDASQMNVLMAAGIERAQAVALTMNHPQAAARAVALLRQNFPDLEIFVRARDLGHGQELQAAGATAIVPEATEMSFQFGAKLLQAMGFMDQEVSQVIDAFRREDYAETEESIPAEGGLAAKKDDDSAGDADGGGDGEADAGKGGA